MAYKQDHEKQEYQLNYQFGYTFQTPSVIFTFLSTNEFWAIHPIPLTTAVWGRLAEICVRACYITMTFVSALIFEEIDEQISNIAEMATNTNKQDSLVLEMDRLTSHYELANQLMEKINKCFDFVLLIITIIDFISAIFHFNQIYTSFKFLKMMIDIKVPHFLLMYKTARLLALPLNEFWTIPADAVVMLCIKFGQDILRFSLLLVAAHRTSTKASI